MSIVISAKPIEWLKSESTVPPRHREWFGDHGFHITENQFEPPETRFSAAWGEGEPEYFADFESAQAWCQEEIDSFMRQYVVISDK